MTTTNGVADADPTQYAANNGGLGNIGKSDFLNLLTAQLKHQDPLNPSSQEEMVATLAQFTALEQSAQMVEHMAALNRSNTWSQGLSLMNRMVEAVDDSGALLQGRVSAVRWDGDALRLTVGGGEALLTNLTRVLA